MQKARLADAGLYYLKSDSIESFSQMDFVAAQAVARMVLRVADEQIQILENLTVGDFVVLSSPLFKLDPRNRPWPSKLGIWCFSLP